MKHLGQIVLISICFLIFACNGEPDPGGDLPPGKSYFEKSIGYNNETMFVYSSYYKLSDLDRQKISFESFNSHMISEIVKKTEEYFECSIQTESLALPKCNGELVNSKEKLSLYIPNFQCFTSNCGSGLEGLELYFRKVQTEIGGIENYPSSRVLIRPFTISEYNFYSKSRLKTLRNIVDRVLDSLKHPEQTYSSACIDVFLGGEPNLFSSWESNDFLSEKCINATNDEYLLSSFMFNPSNYLYSTPLKIVNPFSGLHENFRKLLSVKISSMNIKRLIHWDLTHSFKVGARVDRSVVYLKSAFSHYVLKNMYRPFDFTSNLEKIQIKNKSEKVTYNGVSGYHDYSDLNLFMTVFDLANFLARKPEKVIEGQTKYDYESIFKNTNTFSPDSRIESFDLLVNMLYRIKNYRETYLFSRSLPLSYTDFLADHIRYLIGAGGKASLYAFQREKTDSAPSFECVNFTPSEGNLPAHNSQSAIKSITKSLVHPQGGANNFSASFFCGDRKFTLFSNNINEEPLNEPVSMNYSDGYVDVLLTFGITSEIPEEFFPMIRTYFSLLDYELEIRENEDTKTLLQQNLLDTDVFIPIGHGLTSRELDIGSEESLLYVYTREAREGERYGVRLKALFPVESSKRYGVAIDELSRLYNERITERAFPLFTFFQTCKGVDNLYSWGVIYRNAIRESKADNGSFPYVIVSSGGFPTRTNEDMVSNVLYTTDLLDVLAQGQSPEGVYDYFKNRNYNMLSEEIITKLRAQGLPEPVVKATVKTLIGDDDAKVQNFLPEYNLSSERKEKALRQAGKQFLIKDQKNSVIFEEIY